MDEIVIACSRYIGQLRERLHNGLVKIITGIRRCEKSFLLFRIFRGWFELGTSGGAAKNKQKTDSSPVTC